MLRESDDLNPTFPGLSSLVSDGNKARLYWMFAHYPDGPDCVGPMNLAMRSIEELISESLLRATNKYSARQHDEAARHLLLRGCVLIAASLVALVTTFYATAIDHSSLIAFLACPLLAAFGVKYLIDAKSSAQQFRDDIKQWGLHQHRVEQTEKDVESRRCSLSEEACRALRRAPAVQERISRDDFDTLLYRINNNLLGAPVEAKPDAKIASQKAANWVNALYVLEDFCAGNNWPGPIQPTSLNVVIHRAVQALGDDVVIHISLPNQTISDRPNLPTTRSFQ